MAAERCGAPTRTGNAVEHGQHAGDGQPGERVPDGAERGDGVQGDADRGAVPFPGEERRHEPRLRAGEERTRGSGTTPAKMPRPLPDAGVENEGRALIGAVTELECRADDGGRERQHRCGQQQGKVAPKQPGADACDPGEELVVIDPDDPDVRERRQVSHVGRPLGEEVPKRCPAVLGSSEIEDRQRDGDGEDAVTQGLDAAALGGRAPVCTGFRRLLG